MAFDGFSVSLEAAKSGFLIIFPIFFKNKTNKIIGIYCSELILMVNGVKTFGFMPKSPL
jgi:hypothetical protein